MKEGTPDVSPVSVLYLSQLGGRFSVSALENDR